MSFLDVEGRTFLVFGVANKRSIAYHVGRVLEENGARVVYSVRSEARREIVNQLLSGNDVFVCDVEDDAQIAALGEALREKYPTLDGVLHSVASADYESFSGVFHEVRRQDFLRCVSVSCYSLIAIADALRPLLAPDGSVVTISISTTRMAVEAYGYMAPAKAALDSAVAFLAKSFSVTSRVRFNAVCAGLLKTSASAGIPGYIDHYLYAEQVIPRKQALTTEEVAHTAAFLLSPRSSGINAQGIVVDAGMSMNYFDSEIVRNTLKGVWPTDTPRE